MAEQNPINFTPTTTGIGQGAAQVVNAQIKDLDYGAIQRAASAIGTAAAQIAQGAKRTREKNELIKRQYDAKVADTGGLKFNQTKEARDVLVDEMTTELLEAGTQAEKDAIYNKYIPELNLIKQEDTLYQKRIEAIGEDDRNTLFSNTEDGAVIGVMDIVDQLNSPLTETQRNSLIADGAGQFVTGLDSYHNNIFKYAGTPETVGLEEVGAVLKAMEINQTIPVETDTEGKIDVYKTFEKLDADQRAMVENALLNPNSAFSQSYRNDQAIRQGTIDIPTTLDETTGFDIYDGQRDLLNNIIQSQMAVETKIYKDTGDDDETKPTSPTSTGLEIVKEDTIPAQPTQAFLSADGDYKSLPMVNTAEGFAVEGSDGKKYTISGFAYDSENDIKYAVTPDGRVIAPDNPDISNGLAETWESNFTAKKPENKQYLTASFDIIKDIEGSTLPESEDTVVAFNAQLDEFGKGVDNEDALYDFLADITDFTSEEIKFKRIAGPGSKTFDERFGGPLGGEDINSEQSKKAIKNWVMSVNPTYFAPDVYAEQKKKIDAFYNPTNTTEEAKAEESNKGGATGNSLDLDVFPTPKDTNSAAPTPTPAPKEKVVAEEEVVTEKPEGQPSNAFVTNTAQKIFDYESTSGSASGKGLKDFGFTDKKYKAAKYDKYREGGKSGAPLTREGALQIFEEEYVSKVPSEYPEIIKEQLVDWKFNAGRSITDLLLVADGTLTEEEAKEDKIFTEEWNREKARIEKGIKENPEEWKAKIKEAKRKMYKLNNPDTYEKTWKNRIEIFG